MKKKAIIILVALILLSLGFIGTAIVLTPQIREKLSSSSESDSNIEEITDDPMDILNFALEEYTDNKQAKAEGVVDVISDSNTTTVNITAMTKSAEENYIQLNSNGQDLHIYQEISEAEEYIYIANETETVQILVEDGSETEETLSQIYKYSIDNEFSEVDPYANDPDVTIEQKDTEKYGDLECYKYVITDSSIEPPSILSIWVDTEDKLARTAEFSSANVTGRFDITYEDVEFEIPSEYEEIDVETLFGIQKLYSIAGDFTDLLI